MGYFAIGERHDVVWFVRGASRHGMLEKHSLDASFTKEKDVLFMTGLDIELSQLDVMH